jgi:hypothetical protein
VKVNTAEIALGRFIQEGAEFCPAGNGAGGVQGEAKFPGIPFSAMADGIDLEKAKRTCLPFRSSQG